MDALDRPADPQDGPAHRPADLQSITTLRNSVRELGDQVDSYQAKTAGAIGAGVFLLLLALGGAYDLVNHNTSISGAIGISHAGFLWLVAALGVGGAALVLLGLMRRWRRDLDREARLATMEQKLAQLESDAATH